jgi:CHAT domain-containing protein
MPLRILLIESVLIEDRGAGSTTPWNDLERALRDARVELARLLAARRGNDPAFGRKVLSEDEILYLIPHGGALVVPIVSSHGAVAIVLREGASGSAASIVEMPDFNDARLVALLGGDNGEDGWARAYGDSKALQRAMLPIFQAIRKEFVAPLEGALNDVATGSPVVIIRHPRLGVFPLHAVQGLREAPLLARFAVTFTPSLGLLKECKARTSKGEYVRSLTVLANPTMNLQYSEVEGVVVAKMFGDQATALRKDAGLDDLVNAATQTSYLHVASHAKYQWHDPRDSHIFLAGANLTMRDIAAKFDLKRTRLVTLSACESGISDNYFAPNESLGLHTAFIEAGAGMVIATHWRVIDAATMILMTEFYQRHLEGGLAPAEALRQAQLFVRSANKEQPAGWCQTLAAISGLGEEYRARLGHLIAYIEGHADEIPFAHPYYWAAFAATGA